MTSAINISYRTAALAMILSLSAPVARVHVQKRPLTIEDCIQMVRIEPEYGRRGGSNFAFSNDGRQFVTTIWKGDLQENLNDYTLLLFNAANLQQKPRELLKVSYSYDSKDQDASPLSDLAFLDGNHVAALATFKGEPRQVVSIDLTTKTIVALTDEPSGVVAFSAASDGKTIVYAVQSPAKDAMSEEASRKAVLIRDGFSLEDREAIGAIPIYRIATGDWFARSGLLRYFVRQAADGRARQVYEMPGPEAGSDPPQFWIAPDGRHAVVYPYSPGAPATSTVGLMDLNNGTIERLISSGELQDSVERVLWSRDGKSLLVFGYVRLTKYEGRSAKLGEVSLSTRQVTWMKIGPRYDPLGWTAAGDGILLTRGYRQVSALDGEVPALAVLRRLGTGWGEPTDYDPKYDLNPTYFRATNGRVVVGVKDGLSEPPEIAAYDLETKTTRVLTDLNPQLRDRSLGEVTRLRWSTPYDSKTSMGYLVKPVGYVSGKRYPLIIQWIDLFYSPDNNSFILDARVGSGQYNGAAAQVWANSGFMVLLTPLPFPGPVPIQLIPSESDHDTAHIESALDFVDSQGLVDRNKVAIAGWSWAGWQTEYVLTHAKTRFAAAATTDHYEMNLLQFSFTWGDAGAQEIFEKAWHGALPWGDSADRWRSQAIDFKYDRALTPRLIEVHGMALVGAFAEPYEALKVVKTPVEFYLYPDAPHSLKSPLHRLHSLATHTDWFRFWLQGYEDPDPEKKAQYVRWRKMREDWPASKAAASKTGETE